MKTNDQIKFNLNKTRKFEKKSHLQLERNKNTLRISEAK